MKALFVHKIFEFCPDCFGHVGKCLDKKANINSKIFDFICWIKNNYNNLMPNISQEVYFL